MKKPLETRIDKSKLQVKRNARWHTVGHIDEPNNKTIWFQGNCELCGELVPVSKIANEHHIDYGADTTIFLCYTCHNIFHWRLRFKTRYWKDYFNRYGEDFGSFFLCHDILKLFYKHEGVMENIKSKFEKGDM